ncbi:MAG: tetratricopeptide repeat protein [Spirochaetales bacterium]|nr:tetratricopeptide repeat protein [Spirochaetales bacterium]
MDSHLLSLLCVFVAMGGIMAFFSIRDDLHHRGDAMFRAHVDQQMQSLQDSLEQNHDFLLLHQQIKRVGEQGESEFLAFQKTMADFGRALTRLENETQGALKQLEHQITSLREWALEQGALGTPPTLAQQWGEQKKQLAQEFAMLGQSLFERGDHARALRCFIRAWETHPEGVDLALRLARCLSQIPHVSTNHGVHQRVLTFLLHQKPHDSEVLHLSFHWALRMGVHEKIIQFGMLLREENGLTHKESLSLASSLYAMNDVKTALILFEELCQRNGALWIDWVFLARCRERENNLDGALQAYQSALALQPDSPVILKELGSLFFQLNDYSQAVAAFQKISAPTYEVSLKWGKALQYQGRRRGALAVWFAAIESEKFPSSKERIAFAQICRHVVQVASQLKDWERVYFAANKGLQFQTDHQLITARETAAQHLPRRTANQKPILKEIPSVLSEGA